LVEHREFSPRVAMHKRGLCRHALTVTFMDSVETNIILNIFNIFFTVG